VLLCLCRVWLRRQLKASGRDWVVCTLTLRPKLICVAVLLPLATAATAAAAAASACRFCFCCCCYPCLLSCSLL
jgi:hypothetical protein